MRRSCGSTASFDDPLPPEAKDLDAVLIVLFYHDTVWLDVDRARMNAAVFDALKAGGIYGVIDHAGRPGTGTTEAARSLHRIEERRWSTRSKRRVSCATPPRSSCGMRAIHATGTLRRPRRWSGRGTSDRFVLRFRNPERSGTRCGVEIWLGWAKGRMAQPASNAASPSTAKKSRAWHQGAWRRFYAV
jgi:hypothetical protein